MHEPDPSALGVNASSDINDDASRVTPESPWEVAIRLESTLRNVLARTVGKNNVDEAWSDVVLERICRIVELYDPAKGSLDGYVVRNIRWYAYKAYHTDASARKAKRLTSLGVNDELRSRPVSNETNLELQLILDKLNEWDRWLLKTHVMQGFTIEEIAKKMDVSLNTARNRLRNALRAARRLVEGDRDGDTEQ